MLRPGDRGRSPPTHELPGEGNRSCRDQMNFPTNRWCCDKFRNFLPDGPSEDRFVRASLRIDSGLPGGACLSGGKTHRPMHGVVHPR